jgi:hypothetical protein
MVSESQRLPFSFDPLLAEAKRRRRRRRLLGAALLVAVGAIAAAAVAASRLPGGPHSAGPSRGQRVQHPGTKLPQVKVPVDDTERRWRAWVLSHGYGLTVGPKTDVTGMRRRVETAVAASGASLVRLKVWVGNTRQPPVELVVATEHPAVYLRHRLEAVLAPFDHGYLYLQVANDHGAKILEWTLRTREGSLYVKPALDQCSPIAHSELIKTQTCPVK